MKLVKRIWITLIAIICLFIISCVPNNDGNPTPDNNKKVKKSYNFIVQDNVNGRMSNRNNTLNNIDLNNTRIDYIYDNAQNLTNINAYIVDTFTHTNYPIAALTMTYNATSVNLNFHNLVFNYVTHYIFNFDPATRYVTSYEEIEAHIFKYYTYDNNGKITQIEVFHDSTKLVYRFDNFVYSNNNISSYTETYYYRSLMDSVAVPITTNWLFQYSATATTQPEQNLYSFNDYSPMGNNGINFTRLLNVKCGVDTDNLISSIESHYSGGANSLDPAYISNHNFQYTFDSINRVTHKEIENFKDGIQQPYSIFTYRY